MQNPLLTRDELDIVGYRALFTYLVDGWVRRRSRLGALVRYPGWRSSHGPVADALEGFARMAPLLGAWVSAGRPTVVETTTGGSLDVARAFQQGLIAGTDPASPEYWGRMRDRDQRIVEAADIALALWLFRDPVWERLTSAEKERVSGWLLQVTGRETYDNNWHLFVVLVVVVLQQLKVSVPVEAARRHYDRVKEFYLGEGWFSDGAEGKVDYYNAWGFHYSLAWLHLIDPEWDPRFLSESLPAFVDTYRYLVGPEGFPALGRSLCYRMAVPAPLVFGHALFPVRVGAGQARRALDCTWRYFGSRGALSDGVITQGYFGPDPRIVENYSGPASCLWSLRSLVPAFLLRDESEFWRSQGEPLPVEIADYRVQVPATGWTIVGRRADRDITIEMPGAAGDDVKLEDYRLHQRLLAQIYRNPQRPENYAAKYGRATYSSAHPFCVRTPPA